MTSDDSDTPRGNREPTEENESGTPPRDPETGQFLPRDERPTDDAADANADATDDAADANADATDDADHETPGASTNEGETDRTLDDESPDDHQTKAANAGPSSGEREPEPMPDEPESEPTAGEEPTESSDEAEQAEAESLAQTAETEQSSDAAETEPPAKEPDDATPTAEAESSREPSTAARQPTGPVFVTNPNGYPRPATVFLPAQPWLRLPSRPPDHETVSRRG